MKENKLEHPKQHKLKKNLNIENEDIHRQPLKHFKKERKRNKAGLQLETKLE